MASTVSTFTLIDRAGAQKGQKSSELTTSGNAAPAAEAQAAATDSASTTS
jgi:hypothetical protein